MSGCHGVRCGKPYRLYRYYRYLAGYPGQLSGFPMFEFTVKIIPVLAAFILGYLLKICGALSKEAGSIFLRLVFYLTLPAFIIYSVAAADLKTEYILLPFLSLPVVFIIYLLAVPLVRSFNLPRPTSGSYLIGALIMNTGFCMPFIVAAYGSQGMAVYSIFDLGNTFLIMTFIYYLAIKHGTNSGKKIHWRKFFTIPPLWALLAGLIINITGWTLPLPVNSTLHLLGSPTIPLVMISLGLFFTPRFRNFSRIIVIILLRSGVGLFLGFIMATALGFTGMLRALVIICCGAPVGYNTLVFSTLENLDMDSAARLVSFSIFTGIFYVPLLLMAL